MTVTLPAELAPLLAEAGGEFPDADEDRLHELAQGWRRAGRRLAEVRAEGSGIARTVSSRHQGMAVDAFAARWSEIDHHLALGALAAEQAAVAVDAVARATLETKSAIISVLAAGHVHREELRAQAAGAFLGPLIRLLLQLLKNRIGPLLARLGELLKSGLAALMRGVKRAWQTLVDFFETLFGGDDPPAPPPLPPAPVYKRDAPLPHARELIANGHEWTEPGRRVAQLPDRASPNEVLYKRDPQNGTVTNYSVYDESGYIIKRVDLTGKEHGGVPTPHVTDYKLNHAPDGRVFPGPINRKVPREATPEEIP